MKRTVIAAAWIFGATVPLLVGTVLMFGCCALPFHAAIHRVLPLCDIVMKLTHHAPAQQPMPAHAKQDVAKRLASETPNAFRLTVAATSQSVELWPARVREMLSFGAVRCDQDVGLHLLDRTLLI